MNLLRYALHNGDMVSIEDVKNGLKCECLCPSCGSQLIARKGEKNIWHFAHHGESDCNSGSESALHLMAKNILLENKEVFIPAIYYSDLGKVCKYTDVELESHKYEGVIPDVLMTNKDSSTVLFVEIYVSHAVDDDKRKKLERLNIPTIEIDLRDMIEDYTEESVAKTIITGDRTKWIWNESAREYGLEELKEIFDFNDICDFIPCSNIGLEGIWVECPSKNRLVNTNECYGCWNITQARTHIQYRSLPVPCVFRELELRKHSIDEYRNIERKNGLIVSIDVKIDGQWQRWAGDGASKLTPEEEETNEFTEPLGKTIYELWKPEYSCMFVVNLENKKRMVIYGNNGEMYNDGRYIKGKYVNFNGKKHVPYGDYYRVWDANKAVWELELAFNR
ncbi:MAG: hypothetical protein K5656_05950 [Lachnospiraceae bacterium]|nr:hypothetical protein [Lachnospiraceae bacterium]